MDRELLRNLIVNAAILTAFSVLLTHVYNRTRIRKTLQRLIAGAIVGMIGALLMLQSAVFDTTHMLDARSVLIGVVGMFYGPVPTAVCFGAIVLVRLFHGGYGMLANLSALAVSGALGLLWNRYRFGGKRGAKINYNFLDYYLFGAIATAAALLCCFLLSDDTGLPLLKAAAGPMMIVYPLTYLVIGLLAQLTLEKAHYKQGMLESEQRYQIIFENAPVGIAVARGMVEFLHMNAKFEAIMGRAKEELAGMTWMDVVHPDETARMGAGVGAFFNASTDEFRDAFRIFRPDGTMIWLYLIVAAIDRSAPRKQAQYYLLVEDITRQQVAEQALQASLEKYMVLSEQYEEQFFFLRSLFDATEDWVFSKDTHGRYRSCNRAFAQALGLQEAEIIGHTTEELAQRTPQGILSGEVLAIVSDTDRRLLGTGTSLRYEERFQAPGRADFIVDIIKSPYYDRTGAMLGIVCTGRDITDWKRHESEVLYISEHDALTGLHNRAYFECKSRELDIPVRLPVSVIMCDLNGLNLVNDSFGHAKGDELIRIVGEILRSCARESDVVARVGGDEFYILMPNTNEVSAKSVFECIEAAYTSRAKEPDNILRYSSVAMGIATKNREEEPLAETIKTAEEFMYRRKLVSQRGAHGAVLNSIRSTLHEKSNETQEHADRIANLARRIGEILRLSEDDLDLLQLAANLHDIGKISIDQAILLKTTALTEEELKRLRQHPEIGYRITQAIPELRAISEIVLSHHERWDGTGYPQGLRGEQIPLMARIVTVADAFDAMTEGRPYRKAMTNREARDELIRFSGRQFDPQIVELFTKKVYPALEKEEHPDGA